MAKAKSGAKKATAGGKQDKPAKLGLLKGASKVVKAAAKLVKGAATKAAPAAKKAAEKMEKKAPAAKKAAAAPPPPAATKAAPAAKKAAPAAAKPAPAAPAAKPAPAAKTAAPAAKTAAPAAKVAAPAVKGGAPAVKAAAPATKAAAPATKAAAKTAGVQAARPAPPDRPRPRATKLPPVGEPLNKREMEQMLTVGQGRGVGGEGSLKGRLVLKDELPHLVVVGRDKRELTFLLQGPDQEVLPAYVDHRVSVSGLVRKTHNHGGTVDVRKWSAKKPEAEAPQAAAPADTEQKLRYLSPGEVSQITAAGMGAGMKGFATVRGTLEMTGEEYVLVLSNGGTRQQVTFLLEGKGAKALRKHLGQTLQVTGVVDKSAGWGGRIEVETYEPRPAEYRAVSRDAMEIAHVEGESGQDAVEVKLNHGLTVRLQEKPGFIWAIEPTAAKRIGLREANYEPAQGGATREFFFTPRNPGPYEVEFFLAKAFTPAQVERSFKLQVNVKP